jgi:DNA/RNA endonuclease YhcR with UshA esterase domain
MHVRLIAVIFAAATVPAAAHHSFSGEFDVNKPIKLVGTVTKVEWINPHAWIHIDVKRPDGTVESWAIEGGTPNTLMRRGFTKDSLKTGTAIMVDGYLARDGSRKANGRDVTFTDGRKLFMGSPPGQGGPPQ